jgi:hypothetical protein
MSYYDDFGVSAAASPDEIRESYRTLVRLLHPDQHTDAALKAAAEAQMRLLNERFAMLSDPERRRRYDSELAGVVERAAPIIIHAPRPIPIARRKTPAGTLAWMGAALASGLLILWLSLHDGVSPPPQTTLATAASAPEPVKPETAAPSSDSVRALQQQLRIAIAQRDQALAQLMRTSPAKVTPVVESSSPLADPPIAIAPLELPTAAPVAAAAPAVEKPKSFAGMWFYAKQNAPNKNKALYPPEFIETMIVEENGSIHGRYRARYRITDKAISPDVRFEFDGKVSGESAQVAWRGDGGSRGEAQIKLITGTSMEMKWSATEMGPLGLQQGTAVLVRGQ